MAAPNEKLAESLDVLKALQQGGKRVFRSDDLSRVHRERLVANGFLQEVMKGWLISSRPSARAGDSTPWYASFWEFCARYCDSRFGEEWHLSPKQSLLLHGGQAENNVVSWRLCVFRGPSLGHRTWGIAEGRSRPGRLTVLARFVTPCRAGESKAAGVRRVGG